MIIEEKPLINNLRIWIWNLYFEQKYFTLKFLSLRNIWQEVSVLHLSFNNLRYIIVPMTKCIKDSKYLKGMFVKEGLAIFL